MILCQHTLHEISGDAGEAHVEALELVFKAFVIDAEGVHEGGIEIMHVAMQTSFRHCLFLGL
ncbi:MAG: hypothetical protein JWR15_3283 [Prosthecobacter sp.]|nr:hypothetical protein [Prosthecobacter sp.]